MTAVADALAAQTLALVDILSPSGEEQELASHIRHAMPWEPTWTDGETLWYETGGAAPLVVLAGHTDTVPPQGNLPGRIEDGIVHGLGASDMKSGLAVMIELASVLAEHRPSLSVGFLFFPREELPAEEESALPGFFAAVPRALDAELAVLLEPTDNRIHAGCLGNMNASLVFEGRSAHSARPWTGVNAIVEAVRGLEQVVAAEPVRVDVAGLTFVEVLSPTAIRGGIAANVIPDRVEVDVNFRYAPSRTREDAERRLHELVGGHGKLTVTGNSPPARVVVERPLVERLRRVGGFDVEPKQAWTPVAEFDAHGIDAVNLGPGSPRYAHTRDEQVAIPELVRTFEALRRFVTV